MHTKKKKSALSILAFVFPSIPLLLAVCWLIFAVFSAGIDNGWPVFYGSILFLLALAVTAPAGGLAGLICGILALRKSEKKTHHIIAIIFSSLILLASLPIVQLFLPRAFLSFW